jgi:thiol-disulfide isomerase/thioredoxin
MASETPALPCGVVVFVKRDCPTCELVAPVLAELADRVALTVYTQDDPAFPETISERARLDDTSLKMSWHHKIESVPTLLRVESGGEVERLEGWNRVEWETFTGVGGLGEGLPDWRPGCGSLSVDPDREAALQVRFGGSALHSRRVELAALEDPFEALEARGWTDGLPVVPPTEERVMAMLKGTTRLPEEIVAEVPPDLVPCSVEKVAINAVMSGCKPEYLPLVLTAVEAACTDQFNMHGVLATTMGVGPVIVVNGPLRRALGMNTGINSLGQGNRATATIGRALQLTIRNVGGGRPGEVDRATLGNPGKLSFCFAEDEESSPWTPLASDFGVAQGTNALTVFAGEGVRDVLDQLSREPESLCRSYAECMRTVHHPKIAGFSDVMLVVSPEHARIFRESGWSKDDLRNRLQELLQIPGSELVRGARGIAEGFPEQFADKTIPKFPKDGIHIVHLGGRAGLFSAIIGGWVSGPKGSQIICKEVQS